MYILCLGARIIRMELVMELVMAFPGEKRRRR